MITYSEALARLCRELQPLASQVCTPDQWLGGTTTHDIKSAIAVPPFANAAMDGVALRAADTATAATDTPVSLRVVDTIAAGQKPQEPIAPGTAAEIMTGAPLPPNCDTVVPLERLTFANDERRSVLFDHPLSPGANVRSAGEDFPEGDVLVRAGQRIESRHTMALGAARITTLNLIPPPKVAVVITGDEIGNDVGDANGPYIHAYLTALGVTVTEMRRVGDAPDAIRAAINGGAQNADLVISTGGVSAGRFDHVADVVDGELWFHKVGIRPGKPALAARLSGGTPLIGLPGNPIAAAVGLRFIVVPALRRLQGLADEKHLAALNLTSIAKRREFTFFGKAHARLSERAQLEVELLPGQESFKIKPLTIANCWAIVPEGVDTVEPGETVSIAPSFPGGMLEIGD